MNDKELITKLASKNTLAGKEGFKNNVLWLYVPPPPQTTPAI